MSPNFIAELDNAIARFHLLKHPFYVAWSAGTLDRPTLQEYAKQYFQFERTFPTFLSNVHAKTQDPAVRQQLLENLVEEERGDVNHAELWLRFADALGVDRDDVKQAKCFDETSALINTARDFTRHGDTIEGVAALYGYESQLPEIATAKIEGLTSHYDVTSDSGLAFFRVHETADEVHRTAERDMLASLIHGRADEERAIAAATAVARAFWGMLDGIVRECDVNCEAMAA